MPGNDEARSLLIDEARDVARYLDDQGMHYSAAVVRDLIDALSKAPPGQAPKGGQRGGRRPRRPA